MSAARWVICGECQGNGTLDALGAVDLRDFDEDSWADYMDGAYDRQCPQCQGTGKIREDAPRMIRRNGSYGQPVFYQDADDASEHVLRMAEGRC